MNRLKIKQAVVVEGKYDKIKLESVIDAVIIPVNGFGVYRDKEKLALIRAFAASAGIAVLTDGDDAGRQIRNYIKNAVTKGEVYHVYVPSLVEAEDASADILREAFVNAGVAGEEPPPANGESEPITRERLYRDGLIGVPLAAERRKKLLRRLNMPENLSATALLEFLNAVCKAKGYEKVLKDI